MLQKELTIRNRAGIHARPAALIVQTATKFACKINFQKDNETVNAKSIMGIITLGAGHNTKLTVTADGEDEQDAVDALERLFESRFEDE